MGPTPTTAFTTGVVCFLLIGFVIDGVEARCRWGDMRFRQGYRFSLSPVCGMCRCGPGGRWICPQNVECEKQPLVLTCTHRGHDLRAGQVAPHVDGCNNCTCHVGGQVMCTNSTTCTPALITPTPPPIRNPLVTCSHRGQQMAIGEVFPAGGELCHMCECKDTGRVECADNCPKCYYNNTQLQRGDVVPALDGCNTCECHDEGRVVCTEKFCHVARTKCTHEGRVYHIGDVFQKRGDPCNTCDCGIDGQVACTNQKCPARAPAPSGGRRNQTCVYKGQSYAVGEEWMWAEGVGTGCDRCRCLLEPSSHVTWSCSSACPDPPPSLWSRLQGMLSYIYYRLHGSQR